MKIKMSRFSSLADEAKRLGVPLELVKEYQQARKAWKDRVRWYAKKYGSIESGQIPPDIRNISKYKDDTADYLRSRIMTIKSRTKHAASFLRNQQRIYIENIFRVAEDNGADVITPEFIEWLDNAGSKELSDIINVIGTDVLEIYYPGKDSEDLQTEYVISKANTALALMG